MGRSHLYRLVTGEAGNVIQGTTVTVCEPGSTTPLVQTMYQDAIGSLTYTNPLSAAGGIEFYLDQPQQVCLIVRSPNGNSKTFDNIDVLPPPDSYVQAQQPLVITNTPTGGQFLQASSAGAAAWVDAANLEKAQPTPLVPLASFDFSGGSLGTLTLNDLSGGSATPTYVSTVGDTLPGGYSFTQALKFPLNKTTVLRSNAFLFAEHGSLTFVYKVVSTNGGQGAAVLRVSIDGGITWRQTEYSATQVNQWLVGYLDNVPPGSHIVQIQHIVGTDATSYVLLGALSLQYGGNVPFHTHGGYASGTVVLGDDAAANFEDSTVVGAAAQSTGVGATAFGAHASAGASAVAVGHGTTADADGSVVVGALSSAQVQASNAVVLGSGAQALATGAVVLGALAVGSADNSTSTGASAQASGEESLALGAGALATHYRSVALGAAAQAVHDYSVAIGPSVVTTADHQLVLGDITSAVEIPGDLVHTGATASIGGASAVVGFFGEPGTTRPTVTGSRGGNAVLAALLTALDNLGLIVDGTSA